FEEVALPANAHRRAGKIAEECGLQQSLEIDCAVVAVRTKRPDEFCDFTRAANAGTVSPLVGVNRNETNIQTAQFHDDLVLAFDQPVDLRFRKGRTQLRDGRQTVDDVAQGAELHDKEAMVLGIRHVCLPDVSRILWITSPVEWSFGSPAMRTCPPYAITC